MRTWILCLPLAAVTLAACSEPAPGTAGDPREELVALERESHERWLQRDVAALDQLMADDFHFVAMNGALEPKSLILGTGRAPDTAESPLQVASLHVEPEEVLLRDNTAVMIALLHIDATARGRPLPNRMRILTVFTRDGGDDRWRLMARSITPILAPPQTP